MRRWSRPDAGEHAPEGEHEPDADAEAQQRQVVEQQGGHRRVLHERHPARGVAERVERGAAEQDRDHRDQPRPHRHGVQVGQRAADHQGAVAPAPHRDPGDQARVDLEGVGSGVEGVAEERAAEQHHREVRRAPQPHRAQLVAVGVDQLDPDEREQARRGRPVTQALGIGEHALLGVAAGDPGEEPVDAPDRADRLPDRTEQQRGRDQPHPPPDVEHPEQRVGEQVLAQDGRDGGVPQQHQARPRAAPAGTPGRRPRGPARRGPGGRWSRRRSAGCARRARGP